jgi:hypothetical protein
MIETMQSLAEVLTNLAQKAINEGKEVVDQPLFVQVSSDHTEVHIRKGDLHIMVSVGAEAAVWDINNWEGEPIQNPYWVNDLKITDIMLDAWTVAYNADRVMVAS